MKISRITVFSAIREIFSLLSVRYPTLFSGKIFSHMFSDMLELFSRMRIFRLKIHQSIQIPL